MLEPVAKSIGLPSRPSRGAALGGGEVMLLPFGNGLMVDSRAMSATPAPPPPPARATPGWALLFAVLALCVPLVRPLSALDPQLAGTGLGGAAALGIAAALAPRAVSVWAAALWAMLTLMCAAVRLAEASPTPILGLAPETALVALLGMLYVAGAAYVCVCPLLEPRMKIVLGVLAAWALAGVGTGLGRGLTLWDLVMRRGSPFKGTGPYVDPTFVGVNGFLICALAAGLFDLFARLITRDWRRAGAVLALVVTLFAGERYLLERYDARGLPSFRTVLREALRVPER